MITNDKNRVKPFGAVPSDIQTAHMNLEKKAFFHFGMNTFSGAEWGDGKESEKDFAPTNVDTRQWIRSIKEAGFKLAIITVKHHDGFCLWPSKYTEHTIKGSPYKNGEGDIIREFTDACREYGLKVGLYISPWDRNSKYWGMDEYSNHYSRQLEELMPNYGRIDEVWWDGAGSSETVYRWEEWYKIIKKHHPEALMFGSLGATDFVSLRWVGNESGFAGETHYASIDPESLRVENVSELNTGKLGAERYIPAEVDVSIRPGWFYHADQGNKVKSPRALDDIWFNSVGRNAMMLLNFPPNRDGVIEELDITRAVESHKRIEKMRSENYFRGARAYTDSGEDVSVLFGESSDFFCASENEVGITIELPQERHANVFAISELFEKGERITSFSLSDAESGELIAKSTSVGRLKAARFPERSLKKLRLEVKAAAPVTLKKLYLWSYTAPAEEVLEGRGENLLEGSGAKIEFSEDKKSVILNFGGIYDFDTIEFTTVNPTGFQLFGFDGSKFYRIHIGTSTANSERFMLDEAVKGCYQIKLAITEKFADKPKFAVYKR